MYRERPGEPQRELPPPRDALGRHFEFEQLPEDDYFRLRVPSELTHRHVVAGREAVDEPRRRVAAATADVSPP